MERHFTLEEKILIEAYYPNTPTEYLSKLLDRPICSIYSYANRNGINKTAEYLQSANSGRRLKGYGATSTSFAKGHTPVNKGKTMSDDLRRKVEHTFFKKGNTPCNTKYDGYISERKDKSGRVYLHIRIAPGKHVLLHRHIWEQANGEIPAKHLVTFKDGNSKNCSLDNLELISMKENRRRNSFWEQVPAELQPVKRLIANVKLRITKQQKKDEK